MSSLSATSNTGITKIAQSRAIISPIPIPSVNEPGNESYILIRTTAVALNPTDWQTLDEPFITSKGVIPEPLLMGCDAAGIVVEIGSQVKKKLRKGDRVAGMSHGGKCCNA